MKYMQKEINGEYWEGKRLQEARESATKNSIGLLDIAERLGLLKNKYKTFEDFYTEFNGICNKIIDNILQNIDLKQKDFQILQKKPVGNDDLWSEMEATINQKQALQNWIDRRPELESEIDWDKLNKQTASDKLSEWKERFTKEKKT